MPIKAAQAEEEQKGPMINAKHRRMARQWWETRPLRYLVTMRLIMEPLREMMMEMLAMSCDEWSQTACNKAAATENRSEPTSRKFRVYGAAHDESSSNTSRAHLYKTIGARFIVEHDDAISPICRCNSSA